MRTDTHSECVLLRAFALQNWLRERVSILRLYVHCVSRIKRSAVYCYSDGYELVQPI